MKRGYELTYASVPTDHVSGTFLTELHSLNGRTLAMYTDFNPALVYRYSHNYRQYRNTFDFCIFMSVLTLSMLWRRYITFKPTLYPIYIYIGLSVWHAVFKPQFSLSYKFKLQVAFETSYKNRTGWPSGNPGLYSECVGFESRRGHRVSWVGFSVALLSPSKEIPWEHLDKTTAAFSQTIFNSSFVCDPTIRSQMFWPLASSETAHRNSM
jgi:hypothetical protein